MNILSLCDGMSCGQIALKELGVKVDHYYAAEIKPIAVKVTKENFPDTIFIGDVTKISYKDGVLTTETGTYMVDFDLVMFGSPCQTFSVAMKTDKRIGLKDMEKSGLFLECYRILKEVNPKYFFIENVASMTEENRNILSATIGVQPYKVQAGDYGPVLRNRYYWTNIPFTPTKVKDAANLQDILETGYTDRKKGRCLLVSDSRPLSTPIKMFHRYRGTGFTTLIFKSEEHYNQCCECYDKYYAGKPAKEMTADDPNNAIFAGVRYLTQRETERAHGIPEGYTNCLTENEAKDVIGDGWSVYVIKDFFKFFKK